jgi:hypothetical protein
MEGDFFVFLLFSYFRGYVKYRAFFVLETVNRAKMIIDYSKQIGKNLTTKGYKKNIVIIEEIVYIQCEDHLSTIHLITGAVITEIKTFFIVRINKLFLFICKKKSKSVYY